ncbi:hypothetical protein BpHYR1_000442 [Brachionus plicatilis]|uniref:Uncharacterized protein n=1 Tax=Brachionus plicatilis TaxID=10195 RepID=A0A3M7PKX1_BRAPC|nr:hypothetical protein BpHYR1_000442 [Brachionus plicatilis]
MKSGSKITQRNKNFVFLNNPSIMILSAILPTRPIVAVGLQQYDSLYKPFRISRNAKKNFTTFIPSNFVFKRDLKPSSILATILFLTKISLERERNLLMISYLNALKT